MNSNKMAEQLVESIRRICREKGVSIMQMENDLGFSAGLVSRWIKTKTCPSFDKIVDIMEYLDISYEELMKNAKPSGDGKEKKPAGSENENDRLMIQLENGSVSGDIAWEKAGEDVPFEIQAEAVFPHLLDYDMHRVYFAAYKKGWFLFSVQYNEETADVLMAVYMLVAAGRDMMKLDAPEEKVMKLLKVIDEDIFNRINQNQADKMIEDFLSEDFQNRYRSVS